MAGLAAVLLAIPATASAAVHVDPGGPAGKQYSDSLDEARVQNGEGDPGAAVPGSDLEAPLFGQGVGPGQSSNGGKPGDESADAEAADDSAVDIADGGGGTPLVAGIVAAILALGASIGFGMQRLTRARPG